MDEVIYNTSATNILGFPANKQSSNTFRALIPYSKMITETGNTIELGDWISNNTQSYGDLAGVMYSQDGRRQTITGRFYSQETVEKGHLETQCYSEHYNLNLLDHVVLHHSGVIMGIIFIYTEFVSLDMYMERNFRLKYAELSHHQVVLTYKLFKTVAVPHARNIACNLKNAGGLAVVGDEIVPMSLLHLAPLTHDSAKADKLWCLMHAMKVTGGAVTFDWLFACYLDVSLEKMLLKSYQTRSLPDIVVKVAQIIVSGSGSLMEISRTLKSAALTVRCNLGTIPIARTQKLPLRTV